MSLRADLEADVRGAMRAGDTTARDTLRMVLAAVKQTEIDLDRELNDDEVRKILATAKKTRQDAAEQFEAAGRPELAAIERAQQEVVVRYLPRQLDEAATRAVLAALLEELGVASKQDTGRVMKELMTRHRGEIDGRAAQQILGELLS